MNEGNPPRPTKPAKAKWWSRPRGEAAGADAGSGALSASSDAHPDFELAHPTAPVADGDFELPRPALPAADAATDAGGDFELRAPLPASEAEEGARGVPGAERDAPGGEPVVGDAEPAVRAAEWAGREVGPGAVDAGSVGPRDDEPVVGADAVVRDAVALGGPGVESSAMGEGMPSADVPRGASGERPKPLHDPDPYSTPPYGEPGPWAPAPPVQHPAATPAHGTAISAPGTAAQASSAVQASSGPHTSSPPLAPPMRHASPAPHPGPVEATSPAPPAASVPPPVTPPSASVPPQGPAVTPPAVVPPQGSPPPVDAPNQAPAPALDVSTPPADPWHRYDPWSTPIGVAAPLQQTGAAVPTKEQRRKRAKKVLVGGALLIGLVSGGVGGVVGAYLERDGGLGDVSLPQAGKVPAGRAPDSVAGIAARALPSVVTLHVSGSGEKGTGTGFVLDTRGYILTNNHVVQPAASSGDITVTFSSGDTAKARIVGRDTGYDLAVVRVTGVHGLTPLPLGNSDNVQVGDPVVAIGAPFDLANTVTSGIISAKERPITAGGEGGGSQDGSDVSYVDALQTDAPINPGNSGGPLLDSQGRVIGINSAIRSADNGSDLDGGQAGSIGLGFAIPVNQARRVAEELINKGRATHPVIGVTIDMGYSGDGARIDTKSAGGGSGVIAGGPGDRAGLEPGDVITEIDGTRVHTGEELVVRARAHRPGDRLRLTVERDGRPREVSLVLGSSDRN